MILYYFLPNYYTHPTNKHDPSISSGYPWSHIALRPILCQTHEGAGCVWESWVYRSSGPIEALDLLESQAYGSYRPIGVLGL